jgi:hypothetical protein
MRPGPPPPPQPFPVPPRRPKPPVSRLVAGLLWLVAGITAGVSTLFDIYLVSQPPRIEQRLGFWGQTVTSSGREIPSAQVLHGVSLVLGAVVVLLGGLLVLVSRRRWAGVVVGTFGAGALLSNAVYLTMGVVASRPNEVTFSLRLGFWLMAASAVVAVVALVVVLAPVRPVMYPPQPPPPPPPPRWEPQTPRFGIPVQQPPPPTPPAQPTPPAPAALEQEDRTVALPEPEPPTPGSISRKLDGNEN